MYVDSAVTCDVDGSTVTIGWFKSSDHKTSYRKAADQFGSAGISYGDDFVVECPDDQSACDAVVKAAS